MGCQEDAECLGGHQAERRLWNSWEGNRWSGGTGSQEDTGGARRARSSQEGPGQAARRGCRVIRRAPNSE